MKTNPVVRGTGVPLFADQFQMAVSNVAGCRGFNVVKSASGPATRKDWAGPESVSYYFWPVPLQAEQLTQLPISLCPPDPPQRGHVTRLASDLMSAVMIPPGVAGVRICASDLDGCVAAGCVSLMPGSAGRPVCRKLIAGAI